jgi:hypothetical protein
VKKMGAYLAVAGCLAAVSGCTVPTGGVIGVTVDAEGKAVVVVQMCEGHIDGATMHRDDETFGRWEVSSPVTGFSQFDLETGGNGWAVADELVGRDSELRYTIYGWSNDNNWSATSVEFSNRDLAEQKPGSVLVLEPETNLTRSESLEDFKTKTCEGW